MSLCEKVKNKAETLTIKVLPCYDESENKAKFTKIRFRKGVSPVQQSEEQDLTEDSFMRLNKKEKKMKTTKRLWIFFLAAGLLMGSVSCEKGELPSGTSGAGQEYSTVTETKEITTKTESETEEPKETYAEYAKLKLKIEIRPKA